LKGSEVAAAVILTIGKMNKKQREENAFGGECVCTLRLQLTPPTSRYVFDVCRFFFLLTIAVVETSASEKEEFLLSSLLHNNRNKKQMCESKNHRGGVGMCCN